MKKILMVGLILVLILTSGVLMGCSCEENGVETDGAAVGKIEIPGVTTIKVVHVDFPEGVELKWQKLGMDEFLLDMEGTFKNVSDQTNEYLIDFTLDGELVGRWPTFLPDSGWILKPGEQAFINVSMIGWSENSKTMEIRIRVKKPTAAFNLPTLMPPPQTETKSPTQNSESVIFTEAPKNPQAPSEVIAAFYFLWYKGDYNGAMELASREIKATADDLKLHREDLFKGKTLESIEIESIDPINEKESNFTTTFYYTDGTQEHSTRTRGLLKEDGNWRMR